MRGRAVSSRSNDTGHAIPKAVSAMDNQHTRLSASAFEALVRSR